MKSETELLALHGRLVKMIAFATSMRLRSNELRELVAVKVQLEWILGLGSRSPEAWAAELFRALNNLEGLKQTYERSRKAVEN